MADQTVVIPYEPRDWAWKLHDSTKRWIVIVAHRRSGKTTAAINHLQRSALTVVNSRYAYISPTYKQSKNIAWDILKFYSRPVPGVEFNEAELTVKYPNGSRLTLYGADNPDSLRGIGLWGVVFDEYSQQPSNIFTEIIRPALADHSGYAIWIGTPKGKNEFYRLYAGLDSEGKPLKDISDWLRLFLTVDHTKIIPQEELDSARAVMSEDEFQQEWYCSFEASIKGAYYATQLAEARRQKRITIVNHDPALRVHTVWDLGRGPNMAVGFYQRSFSEIRKIDYMEGSGSDGLPQMIAAVLAKPYVFGKHFAPHDIQATDLSTGQTRIETARKLGMDFDVVPNIGVDDGIEAAKRMFSRLWVDEAKCALWLESIAQYRQEWDDKRGMFKETPYHDWTSHGADEFRYAAVIEQQMKDDYSSVKVIKPTWKGFNKAA